MFIEDELKQLATKVTNQDLEDINAKTLEEIIRFMYDNFVGGQAQPDTSVKPNTDVDFKSLSINGKKALQFKNGALEIGAKDLEINAPHLNINGKNALDTKSETVLDIGDDYEETRINSGTTKTEGLAAKTLTVETQASFGGIASFNGITSEGKITGSELEIKSGIHASDVSGYKIWSGTQSEYDEIVSKDAKTIYFITA